MSLHWRSQISCKGIAISRLVVTYTHQWACSCGKNLKINIFFKENDHHGSLFLLRFLRICYCYSLICASFRSYTFVIWTVKGYLQRSILRPWLLPAHKIYVTFWFISGSLFYTCSLGLPQLERHDNFMATKSNTLLLTKRQQFAGVDVECGRSKVMAVNAHSVPSA